MVQPLHAYTFSSMVVYLLQDTGVRELDGELNRGCRLTTSYNTPHTTEPLLVLAHNHTIINPRCAVVPVFFTEVLFEKIGDAIF